MLPVGVSLYEWLDWLETLSPREIDLGLDRMATMLKRLAPARPAHVFLIAGTNGKGSSVAICDALLRAAGMSAGAYTSPHLHRFNERIVIDGQVASDDAIVAALERIESCRDDLPLTYFEYTTLAAVLLFAAAKLDVWILEIGLGGRLDASNAIEPSASLITNISLDHSDWLGDSIEEIAVEKAGVMRTGVVTVYADACMPAAIDTRASTLGAHLLRSGRDYEFSVDFDGSWSWRNDRHDLTGLCRPGLRGEIQITNTAGVMALLAAAGLDQCLDETLINRVLPTLSLSGRVQKIRIDDRTWIFDVAHNAAAAQVLATVLTAGQSAEMNGDRSTVAIIGLMKDKHVQHILDPLLGCIDRWVAVSAASSRALATRELARCITNRSNKACLIADNIDAAIEFTRRASSEGDRIVVTGSFLTVGPALRILGQN